MWLHKDTCCRVTSAAKTATRADMQFTDCPRWTTERRYRLFSASRPWVVQIFSLINKIDRWINRFSCGFVNICSVFVLSVSIRALWNQCLPTAHMAKDNKVSRQTANVYCCWLGRTEISNFYNQCNSTVRSDVKTVIKIRYLHFLIRLGTRVDHVHSVIISIWCMWFVLPTFSFLFQWFVTGFLH